MAVEQIVKRRRVDRSACQDGESLEIRNEWSVRVLELEKMYQSSQLCDGQVSLRGSEYPVSRMLLAASSKFFSAAYSGQMLEATKQAVKLDPSLSVTCVSALLKFAHTGSLQISMDELINLYRAADQLGFTEVVTAVAAQLPIALRRSNCLEYLEVALVHNLEDVAFHAVRVLDQNFDGLCKSRQMMAASHDALQAILKGAVIASETALLETLLAWVREDPSARTTFFEDDLEHIRLPEVGLKYMAEHLVHTPLVLNSQRAQGFVQHALVYLATDAAERPKLDSFVCFQARLKRLHPIFVSGPSFGVNVTNQGSRVQRTTRPFWKGAHTQEAYRDGGFSWKLKIIEVSDDRTAEFFIGIALTTVGDDDDHTDFKEDGKLGLKFSGAQVGDVISFFGVSGRHLSYTIQLVAGRTELPGLESLVGCLLWTIEGDWVPYVQMNREGCCLSVVA